MLPRVDIPNYTGNGGGCIGQYKSTPWQNPYGAPAGSDTCGPKTDFKFGWTPLADSEGLHVLYCSYDNNLSPQPAGVTVRGYDYKKYEAGAVHYMPPFRFPGQYFDEETGFHENWNRYYEPQSGRYLSPEPLLQNPKWVKEELTGGHPVATYAYARNNPVTTVDPTGLGPIRFDLSFCMTNVGCPAEDTGCPGHSCSLVSCSDGAGVGGVRWASTGSCNYSCRYGGNRSGQSSGVVVRALGYRTLTCPEYPAANDNQCRGGPPW